MVFFPIGKICKYEVYIYMCLQSGFIKHDML